MENISDKLQQRILRKAHELQKIGQAIKASLPLDCHTHLDVIGIRENELILLTDSPVWQTRLRMFSQTILEALHQHAGITLTRVKIKLAPPTRVIAPDVPPKRTLSKDSARVINQTAGCISDPALREAMLRLSKKAK
jgi:hypothetical protein